MTHLKLYMRRSDTEVGMVAAYHLCGRYGHIMLLGRGSASVENGKIKSFPSDDSAFFFWFPPVEMTCLVPVSTTESRSASPAVRNYAVSPSSVMHPHLYTTACGSQSDHY